jgi:hypothetical protein
MVSEWRDQRLDFDEVREVKKINTHTNNTYTQCGVSGYSSLLSLNPPKLCFRFFIDKFKPKSCSYGSVSGEMKSDFFKSRTVHSSALCLI